MAAGREESGNAFLSGRELAIEDALASKAHIDALAVALRRGGLPGTLQRLRVLAFNDLTQGRDPLDRLTGPEPADAAGRDARQDTPAAGGQPGDGDGDSTGTGDGDGDDDDASWDGCPDMPEWQHERRGTREDDDHHHDDPGAPPGPPAPFPALINLTVPAGTAYGWSTAPGEAGGWGLTDPGDTRRLLQAASLHPRTRWCFTLLAPDGTAAAHGCARGPHPWIPPPDSGANPGRTRHPAGRRARRTPARAERHLHPDRQGQLRPRQPEDRYTPSRKLKHLIRARTATCTAPGCGAQAAHCDLDHTLAYPAGITCQCDLAPACRRHHRCKQAPGWQLTQPEPGVMCWTTPAGRSYTTRPTVYEQ